MEKTNILIIGAGAVGCAIARELSKYRCKVLVADKNPDVGGDASKSNSAIIHTGYDAQPGTLESKLVVAANPMYAALARDLDVPFETVGALLPAVTDEQLEKLPALKKKALDNGVYDVEYLCAKELLRMEPNLNPEVKAGLYIPRESIIDPFLYVVALAENACSNGAEFLLNTQVTGIRTENGRVTAAETTQGDIQADYIINCAGLHCDDIAAMVGKNDYFVNPRRGQFYIIDRNTACKVNHIVLPVPTKLTKGKLICPTVHGNLLVGPTAEDLTDKDDASTTREGLEAIAQEIRQLVPCVVLRDTITQYSGLRPNRNPEGVHIDSYDDVLNYVNISGVRSTGLTASVAIGKYVAQRLTEMGLSLEFNADFNPVRKGIVKFSGQTRERQDELVLENPLYGKIICRCETVSEGEIVEAIHRPIPATTIDAVKRRLRAGMGRCQGGFCGPRILEIIAREMRIPVEEVTKSANGSNLVTGCVK